MSPTRRQVVAAVAGVAPSLAGCAGGGGADGGEAGTSTPADSGATVRLTDRSFQPMKIEVESGATVTWVNDDSFEHDVTAARFHDAAAEWSMSRTLASGERATHTFEEQGVYEYYCTIHGKSTMCGAVLVGGATLSKSLPCSDDGGSGGGGGGAY
ncbi:MAG: plastocyanin/azurin family copper-binding protein [Halobellus sp.]